MYLPLSNISFVVDKFNTGGDVVVEEISGGSERYNQKLETVKNINDKK